MDTQGQEDERGWTRRSGWFNSQQKGAQHHSARHPRQTLCLMLGASGRWLPLGSPTISWGLFAFLRYMQVGSHFKCSDPSGCGSSRSRGADALERDQPTLGLGSTRPGFQFLLETMPTFSCSEIQGLCHHCLEHHCHDHAALTSLPRWCKGPALKTHLTGGHQPRPWCRG